MLFLVDLYIEIKPTRDMMALLYGRTFRITGPLRTGSTCGISSLVDSQHTGQVMQSFGGSCIVNLDSLLSRQFSGRWKETP